MSAGRLVAIASLTVVLVAGKPFADHKRQNAVQVWQSSGKGKDIMWGRCNSWFRKMRSCILEETTCASHLSPGPDDADVEIRLGNLPVFDGHPTYVQWWAPRASQDPYDPFENPDGAHVYPNMFEAYPRYFDPDFNGGNVQIIEDGEAVIRFKAPSTYRLHEHTRTPLVHLRICSSGRSFSIILGRKDKIQLTPQGPVAKSECNSNENKINILGFRHFMHSSTTTTVTTPKPLVAQAVSLVGRLAETFDLDPLEFSPVFQCLSTGQHYDTVAGDCVDTCPVGAAVSFGQCVRPANVLSSFSAMWHLQVCGCDEGCWADKKNATLHRLRLQIADHLDIPFQEVEELNLIFDSKWSSNRPSFVHMHIRVTSARHSVDTGSEMLRSLFENIVGSSEVLAMLVLGVKELPVKDVGFLRKRIENELDVFEPYYQDLALVKASAAPVMAIMPPALVTASHHSQPSSLASAFGRTTAFLACTSLTSLLLGTFASILLLKCQRNSELAHELPLRSLGEPLAGPQTTAADPPLVLSSNPMTGNAVGPYLETLYVRALR